MLSCIIQVQDLHSVTPDHFLELSGGVIHPLSYQQVRAPPLLFPAEPLYIEYCSFS